MAQLKIISQTLPVRCEICHQTDKFDPLTGYCLRCSVVMVGSNLSKESLQNTRYSKVIRPKEVQLEINGSGLKLTYSTFDWDTILGLLLFIAITSVIFYSGWYLLGAVPAIMFFYVMVATLFNKRVINVNENEITILEGPMPMGINQNIPIASIKKIFSKKGFLGDYQLKAVLQKGETIELLPGVITSEIALYLEQQLGKYLELEKKNNIDLR